MALSWSLESSGTGYKVIKASVTNGTAGTAVVVKNTGAILALVASSASFTGVDQQYLSATLLYVSISDAISDFTAYFVSNPYRLSYKLASPVYYVDKINGSPLLSAGSVVNLPRGQMQVEQRTGINWPAKTGVANKYAYCVDIGVDVVNPVNTGQDNWSQSYFNSNVGLIPDSIVGRAG